MEMLNMGQQGIQGTMFTPLQQGEFQPLLFSLTPGDVAAATPRTPHSLLRGEPSSQRKATTAQTPGSIQAELTPQAPPPPVLRLGDNVQDVVMEEPGSVGRSRGTPPPPMASMATPGTGPGAAAVPSYQQQPLTSQYMGDGLPPQYEDVWVTIFGFTQMDVPLVLREFASCGDILQWGTYGQPQANYLHVQFQNKYGAQRALLRNGEQVAGGLIIGVKPLDPRHRAAIESYDAAHGEPVQVVRPRPLVERPYRVEAVSGAQQVPLPARSMLSKISQYVLGL